MHFTSNNEHFSLIYDAFSTNPHNRAILFASFYFFSLFFSFSIWFCFCFRLFFTFRRALLQPKCQLSHFVFPLICFFSSSVAIVNGIHRHCQITKLLWRKVRLFSIISVAPERWATLIESDRFDTLNWQKIRCDTLFYCLECLAPQRRKIFTWK